MAKKIKTTGKEYHVKASELPVCCPTKELPLWSAHPRVYFPLSDAVPEAICPYCDNKFILKKDA